MSREILEDIINDFSPEKFSRFFREKNRAFTPRQESFAHYDDGFFTGGLQKLQASCERTVYRVSVNRKKGSDPKTRITKERWYTK